jgi:hypothetical protein
MLAFYKGRTESILMSLPTIAKWKYNYKPEVGSVEEKTMQFFLQAQPWLSLAEDQVAEVRKFIADGVAAGIKSCCTSSKKCCYGLPMAHVCALVTGCASLVLGGVLLTVVLKKK